MAGGDLLYIFAFIILPTAVLVSCIWALILLRNGALLPDRRVRAHGDDVSQSIAETDDIADVDSERVDLVEETGEHAIVESTVLVASPIARTPDAPEPVPAHAVADAPPLRPQGDATRSTDEPPPAERTEELDVVPIEGLPGSDEHAGAVVLAAPREYAPVTSDSDAVRTVQPASDASGVLLVPLDDSPDMVRAAPPAASASSNCSESGASDAADVSEPVPVSPSRRPVRRVAQLRSSEDASSRPRPRAGQRQSARRRDGDA